MTLIGIVVIINKKGDVIMIFLLIFISILILLDGAVIGFFEFNPRHIYRFLEVPAGILMGMLALSWMILLFNL